MRVQYDWYVTVILDVIKTNYVPIEEDEDEEEDEEGEYFNLGEEEK